MEPATSPSSPPRTFLQEREFWWLLAVVIAIYACRPWSPSLRGEEPRRGLIAWEMLQTGDWIVPRTQGEPLISRPPGQNWVIAIVGWCVGKVDLWAIRLPSVLAVIGTVILVYWYSRLFQQPLGALTAGAAYATFLHVLELGRLGETEAFFTILVAASLLLWHGGWMRGWSPWVLWPMVYLLVAAGTLTKGPQAPVYFGGSIGLYLLTTGEVKKLFSRAHLTGILLCVALVGSWQWAFVAATDWNSGVRMYFNDVGDRFGDNRWLIFTQHLVTYPLELFVGALAPWSFLLLAFFRRDFRRTLASGSPYARFALIAIGFSFVFVWLPPQSRPRYYMPLYPCFAVLIGLVVDRATQLPALARGVARFYQLAAILLTGLAVAWCGLSLALPQHEFALPVLWASLFVAVSSGFCLAVWRTASRGQAPALWLTAWLGLIFAGPVALSLDLRAYDARAGVAAIKESLPAGTKLVSFGLANHYFALFYGEPIPKLPWPETNANLPGDVEYFCVTVPGDAEIQLPFTWERVGSVSNNRQRRAVPKDHVVVGRVQREVSRVAARQPTPEAR